MSNEPGVAVEAPQTRAGLWHRLLAWVAAFEKAMDTSYDEIQDRRILALEREVSALKAHFPDRAHAQRLAGKAKAERVPDEAPPAIGADQVARAKDSSPVDSASRAVTPSESWSNPTSSRPNSTAWPSSASRSRRTFSVRNCGTRSGRW